MKPILLMTLLFSCSVAWAQKPLRPYDEQLTCQGEHVFQNGERLKPGQVKYYYRDEPQSLSLYTSARLIRGGNLVIAAAGGACVGWELGGFLAANELHVGVLATGIGLVATSLVLQAVTNSKIKKSVELYNGTRTAALHLDYGAVGAGVGVAVRF